MRLQPSLRPLASTFLHFHNMFAHLASTNFLSSSSSPCDTAPSPMTPNKNENKDVLLLEGDTFAVDHDGVARTAYHLVYSEPHAYQQQHPMLLPPVAIEELYDLKRAHKTFLLRHCTNYARSEEQQEDGATSGHEENMDPVAMDNILGKQAVGVAPLGDLMASFQIQEIEEDHGTLFDSTAGTGATTWESSIAMGLYFLSNPTLLRGNVIELGCGVGFGSILSNMGSHLMERERTIFSGQSLVKSVTLTDGNTHVLDQCRQNLCAALNSVEHPLNLPPFRVRRLLWDDAAREKSRYDTVIACDVAYLHTHVDSLVHAIKTLVNDEGDVHMFGPYNRGALQEALRLLQRESFDVDLDFIQMERDRLKPSLCSPRSQSNAYQSKSIATFLHARAHKRIPKAKDEIMNDID